MEYPIFPVDPLQGLYIPNRGKIRKNKAALKQMHDKRRMKRRKRRFLFGRS